MTQEASPVSSPKKRGFGAVKERHEREIAELKERLKRAEGAAQKPGAATTEAAAVIREKGGYDAAADPLAWVKDVDEVYLVSDILDLPGNTISTTRSTKDEDTIENLRAYAQKTWGNCPYRMVGRTERETHEIREVLKAKWHHHRVTRYYADRMFASKWSPFPKLAIIAPADFRNLDYQNQPEGRRTPSSGDNLTELVRYYLQKEAGHIWLDYAYHHEHVEFACPNPYGKGRERFAIDPATVRRVTEQGDLQANWPDYEPPR